MQRGWTSRWPLALVLLALVVPAAAHPVATPDCSGGAWDATGCLRLDLAFPGWSGGGADPFAPGPYLAFAPDGNVLYAAVQDRDQPFWTGFSAVALDAVDGSLLWETTLGEWFGDDPTLLERPHAVHVSHDLLLIVGISPDQATAEERHTVLALDRVDGKIVWRVALDVPDRPYAYPIESHLSEDGTRLAVSGVFTIPPENEEGEDRYDTYVAVFDASNGTVLWSDVRHVSTWPAFDTTPSVAIRADRLYAVHQALDRFGVSHVEVVAHDLDTGTIPWHDTALTDTDFSTKKDLLPVPSTDGAILNIVGTFDDTDGETPFVAVYDADDGTLRDVHDATPHRTLGTVPFVVIGEPVKGAYAGSAGTIILYGEQIVWAIDGTNGTSVWEEPFFAGWARTGAKISHDSATRTLLVTTLEQIDTGHVHLRLLDATTGDRLAETRHELDMGGRLLLNGHDKIPGRDEHLVRVTDRDDPAARLLFFHLPALVADEVLS